MRSSVRLIVPEVPDRGVMECGATLARARLEFQAGRQFVAARMEDLARRSRTLPNGYPSLVVQRRQSHALRWLDPHYRMMSEPRFFALVAPLAPRVRDWLPATHVEARWLNSQERICRFVADEYSALVEVMTKSSSPEVPSTQPIAGGLHHE